MTVLKKVFFFFLNIASLIGVQFGLDFRYTPTGIDRFCNYVFDNECNERSCYSDAQEKESTRHVREVQPVTSLRCRTYRCSTFIDPAIVLLLPVVQASSVSHYCYPEQQKNHAPLLFSF